MASTTKYQREQIVKLFKKGKKQPEISYLLDIPQTTVSFWIRRFKQAGNLEKRKQPGKTPKLRFDQFEELRKHMLNSAPERYGGESVGWTTKLAIKHVEDNYSIRYSMRRMQELLHKMGLNMISPRSEAIKGSHAARTVFREYFKKNWKENIWVGRSSILMKRHSD